MSEMLGNHYFLSRNFSHAIDAYSKAFGNNIPNSVLKKLIICHITKGDISIAKEYFLKLLKEDPRIIIDTDINDEDCPCPELIKSLEEKYYQTKSGEDIVNLAMLWLYCDVEKCLEYFKKANRQKANHSFIQKSIKIINQFTLNKKASA